MGKKIQEFRGTCWRRVCVWREKEKEGEGGSRIGRK
jgi:hypothetical protein